MKWKAIINKLSKLIMFYVVIIPMPQCVGGSLYTNNKNESKIIFEYKGLRQEICSKSICCDSLLSVFVEERIQELASMGYEGKYIIKGVLSVNKKGFVENFSILEKSKDKRVVYDKVYNILQEAKFEIVQQNSNKPTHRINVLLMIDTYQYPSDISKKIFGL